jgi:hypothetical protein
MLNKKKLPARTGMHTHTHKYELLVAFPRVTMIAKAPQLYVERILAVLFISVQEIRFIGKFVTKQNYTEWGDIA